MISAVIFDLDGLLTDTERLHCEAYRGTLQKLGIHLTEEEYADHWIRAGLGIRDFVRIHGIDLDPAALREHKTRMYQQLLEEQLQPMPGALELLRRLHGRKKLALASSSREVSVHRVLDLLGITACFDAIGTDASVERLKPSPDIFLHVAREISVPARECVVVEDAEKGILAAHAAGMKSIAVPNRYTKNNDFSKATLVVDSLHRITVEMLDSL